MTADELENNLGTIARSGSFNFKKENEKYFVDLKGINKQQMLEKGVNKIDVCPFCTNCGEKMFYSYRFENKTGYRHSAVVKCR